LGSDTGIARDSLGHIYVVDQTNDRVVVYQQTGSYMSTIGTAGNGNGQFNQPFGIAIDGSDNLFVTDGSNDRVEKLSSSGAFLAVTGSAGVGNGQFNGPEGIATDALGNVYVLDNGNDRVEKFDNNLVYQSSFGSSIYTGDTNYWYNIWGYFLSAGTVAGTGVCSGAVNCTWANDLNNNAPVSPMPAGGGASACDIDNGLQSCPPYGTGNFDCPLETCGAAACSGVAGEGMFGGAEGIAINQTTGWIYVVDTGDNRVEAFDNTGVFQTQNGVGGCAPGEFYAPVGIAVDSGTGEVFIGEFDRIEVFDSTLHYLRQAPNNYGAGFSQVADPHALVLNQASNASRLFVASTTYPQVDTWNVGSGAWNAAEVDPTDAAVAFGNQAHNLPGNFEGPTGIARDSGCNYYVVDSGNGRIEKFNACGAYLSSFGSGQLVDPGSIALDASGNCYVTDRGNSRVAKFDNLGNFVTSWDGSLAAGQFNWIWVDTNNKDVTENGSIAVNPLNNDVYVVDSVNHRVQVFDSTGNSITSFGGLGAGAGTFANYPTGIAIDASGNAYVMDPSNGLVQEFNSSFTYVSQFGIQTPFCPFPCTTPPATGSFKGSTGLTIGPNGDLYVADTDNNRVEEFTLGGTFVAQYGDTSQNDANQGYEGGGQIGALRGPQAIGFSCNNNMMVVDTGNNRIQKLP
jgi:DNA-binding beta-propeller fold protein YncE